jgi:hypothetical protein
MRAGIGLRFYHLPVEGTYDVSTASGIQLGTVEKFGKGWTARYKDGSNVGWFTKRAEAGDALFSHKRAVAPDYPTAQTVTNELANRYEAATHRIDELENDLRIANEATAVLLARAVEAERRVDELEDHLAAALDVIIAVENKEHVFVVDGSVASKSLADVFTALQVRLDEETKPYNERRLVVRRRPEYGWAVWDKDTGEKLRPVNPNQWFRDRKTALAAKATEQPPMGVR